MSMENIPSLGLAYDLYYFSDEYTWYKVITIKGKVPLRKKKLKQHTT